MARKLGHRDTEENIHGEAREIQSKERTIKRIGINKMLVDSPVDLMPSTQRNISFAVHIRLPQNLAAKPT